MAVFDVGHVVEGIISLQEILEDTITRNKSLIEEIGASGSRHMESNKDHRINLRNLKERLTETQGSNERLSIGLVKFKMDLEAFVNEVFDSHDDMRRDLQLWANVLDKSHAELRHEKEDLQEKRRKFNMERSENLGNQTRGNDRRESQDSVCPANSDLISAANEAHSSVQQSTKEMNRDPNTQTKYTELECDHGLKVLVREFHDHTQGTCSVGCQTESNSVDVKDMGLQTDLETTGVQDGTVLQFTGHNAIATAHKPREYNRILSSRPQTRAAYQRDFSLPVSRAQAELYMKHGCPTRVKVVLDEICDLRDEIQTLKLQTSALSRGASDANSELLYMKNQLTVSETDRDELQKSFQRARDQVNSLEGSLRRPACSDAQTRQRNKHLEEEMRWSQIPCVPLISDRLKRNTLQAKNQTRAKSASPSRGRHKF